MTKYPANSLMTLMGAGIAAAIVASASMRMPSAPVVVEDTAQSVHPSQVQFTCPSGIVNPFETMNVVAGITWSSLATIPVSPAPASVIGQGGVTPTAPTLADQGGSEPAGLSTVGCVAVCASQWVATGATIADADMVLILFNPGPTVSVASIDGYGASGPLNVIPCQVIVPARPSASVLFVGWFLDESVLAVHMTADGGGVAAWMQVSLTNDEIPQGTALASTVVPATTQTILGVDLKGTSLLRLAPSSEEIHVSVSVADSTGVHPLVGGEVAVAEGTIPDTLSDGAFSDPSLITLIVTSDREVVAQTTTITLGVLWAQRASAWIMRSNATPATAPTEVTTPNATQIEGMGRQVLFTTPIHATSLVTNSGVTDVYASPLLYAPTDVPASLNDQGVATSDAPSPSATPDIWASPSPSGGQSGTSQSGADQDLQSSEMSASTPGVVMVRMDGRTICVAPGIPTLVDLPGNGGTLGTDSPIRAVIVVSADTAAGRMTMTWNVDTEGISVVSGTIRTANRSAVQRIASSTSSGGNTRMWLMRLINTLRVITAISSGAYRSVTGR